MRARPALLVAALLAAAPAASGQAQQLPADQLKKIKAATVFIKMSAGPVRGTGSGFLVKVDGTTGFVASNDHVVAGPRTPLGRLQSKVELVFHSGTKDEWTAPGEVVGRDSERDLALVRFTSPKPIPEPLPLTAPEKLAETMPVYVCGFPFGEMMAAGDKHPEISIGLASVSSIRSNERSEVVTVQLNGALNPGNSGGPVVSAEGRLVGVAVRTVRGAGIGEAVPGPMVGEMLRGRVGGTRLVQTREWAAGRMAGLVGQIADPFNKVRNVRGFVAPVGGQTGIPLDVSSVAGAVRLPLRMADPSEMLVFSTVRLPNARQVWVQVEWLELGGVTRRTPATKVDVKTVAQIAEEEEKVARFLQKLFEGKGGPPTEVEDPNAPPSARPPAAPRPGPPAVRPPSDGVGGRGGVIGANGIVLPPLAVGRVPVTGVRSVTDVLADATRLTGSRTELTVQMLSAKVDPDGHGDGPSLVVTDPDTRRPVPALDFVLDRRQADRFRDLRLTGPVLVQLTGDLRDGAGRRPWKVFVVRRLCLVDTAGNEVERSDRFDDPPGPKPPADSFQDGEPLASDEPVTSAPDRWLNRPAKLTGTLSSNGILHSQLSNGQPVRHYPHKLNGDRGRAGFLTFYLSEEFAAVVRNTTARMRELDLPRLPTAEVVFKVARPNKQGYEIACAVSHVRLFDPVTRETLWEGTATPPDGTPAPPGSTPREPNALKGEPPKQDRPPTPEAAMSQSFAISPAVFVLLGVLGIGASVGVGVVIFFVARARAVPPPKKARSRRWEEDDEDDEDDDPPPRKPARRR